MWCFARRVAPCHVTLSLGGYREQARGRFARVPRGMYACMDACGDGGPVPGNGGMGGSLGGGGNRSSHNGGSSSGSSSGSSNDSSSGSGGSSSARL